MKKFTVFFFAALVSLAALCAMPKGPVCIGEMCYPSAEAALADGVSAEAIQKYHQAGDRTSDARVAMGYMKPPEFLAFLRNNASELGDFEKHSTLVILFLVLLGGIMANLTPCVLPLVPVNLILVGRGWKRGAAYGLGMATAYGALGIAASLGAMAFGAIQSSPWFNAVVAVVFTLLALAMSGFFFIDLSKHRAKAVGLGGDKIRGNLGVFFLGVAAAVLAGACVEPILLATLVLSAKWFAAGKAWALVLPLVLGLGMGLPWPFAAAGLSVLPRPGAWMRRVNQFFSVVFLAMAAWYAMVAWNGFRVRFAQGALDHVAVTPQTWEKTFEELRLKGKPVLVDVWATWCKNCVAMEKTTLCNADVEKELKNFSFVRLQAEDLNEFLKLKDFAGLGIKGIPAFVIFDEKRSKPE